MNSSTSFDFSNNSKRRLPVYLKIKCTSMAGNLFLGQISLTSNDRSFDCSIIYRDTIHDAILFKDTSTMFDTTKLIL